MRIVRLLWIPLLLVLLLPAATARAEEETGDAALGDGVDAWMETVDWSAFEQLLAAMPEEVRALWSGVRVRETAERIAMTGTDGAEEIYGGTLLPLLKQTVRSVTQSLAGTVATLLGLALVGGLAAALTDGGDAGVQTVAAFVCRCFTLTVVLGAFGACAAAAGDCMDRLCACMEVASPVLMTLLTAMGMTAGAGVLQPVAALLTGSVAAGMRTVAIPLVLCGGILTMFDQLSERIRLTELGALVKSVLKWSIGIVTTVFTAATAVYGVTASAFDGVSVRAAKYAAGSAFPMVGGLVTGSFDTVMGCAGLVKNAAGLTTILLMASVAAVPMIRIAATMLLMRLTAAAMQPVAEKRQTAMCIAGAEMLSGLLAACAAITGMFIMTAGMAVALGGAGAAG